MELLRDVVARTHSLDYLVRARPSAYDRAFAELRDELSSLIERARP